jgi:Flp pilus assembly protein TadB
MSNPEISLAGLSLAETLEAVDRFITEHADHDERMRATIAATRAEAAAIIRASFCKSDGENRLQ